MKTALALGSILTLAVAAGCGSSGSTPDGGHGGTNGGGGAGGSGDGGAASCSAIQPAGAKMSWMDDGTFQCALVIVTGRMTSSSQDFLEIIGSTSGGVGAGLTVNASPGPLSGTYHCKNDGGASGLFVDFVYTAPQAGQLQDCTITIDAAGTPGSANARGSFSATFTTTGGGTKQITQGTFDTPVMLNGG